MGTVNVLELIKAMGMRLRNEIKLREMSTRGETRKKNVISKTTLYERESERDRG